MLRKLDDIPIKITLESALEQLRVKETEDVELISELFEAARKIVRPKALYREAFVDEISGSNVRINGVDFESDVLAMALKDVHRVFAYVCTCGTEVDDWSRKEKDYFITVWLDMIKGMFLADAIEFLKTHFNNTYEFKNLSAINPGSGNEENWHISQQKQLFEMIGDVKSEIGVTLTNTFLMLPTKTVSGLQFSTESEFSNCALCTRENCISRKVEFNKELYDSVFNKHP